MGIWTGDDRGVWLEEGMRPTFTGKTTGRYRATIRDGSEVIWQSRAFYRTKSDAVGRARMELRRSHRPAEGRDDHA